MCVECDLAEPESLASLGGSAPGVVDGFLSNAIDKINFHLDVGQGRAEVIMSYVQIWTILTIRSNRRTCTSLGPSQAITGHQGPLSPQDENNKGSKYNVMVE